eukprot:7378648-Prymnesium_polylepis.2
MDLRKGAEDCRRVPLRPRRPRRTLLVIVRALRQRFGPNERHVVSAEERGRDHREHVAEATPEAGQRPDMLVDAAVDQAGDRWWCRRCAGHRIENGRCVCGERGRRRAVRGGEREARARAGGVTDSRTATDVWVCMHNIKTATRQTRNLKTAGINPSGRARGQDSSKVVREECVKKEFVIHPTCGQPSGAAPCSAVRPCSRSAS